MNISERLKDDKGNAVIVLGIMLIIAVLAIGAMLLDITKAFQMKAAYNDAAQKAAQAAIMHNNQEGFLTASSIGEAIRVYENIARPAAIKDGYMSFCREELGQGREVVIKVTAMKQNFIPGAIYTINSNEVRLSDTADDIIRRLGFGAIGSQARKDFEDEQYVGIEIELHESTPNIILPNTSVIARVNDGTGYKCQDLGIRAGASQYIGSIEGKYD